MVFLPFCNSSYNAIPIHPYTHRELIIEKGEVYHFELIGFTNGYIDIFVDQCGIDVELEFQENDKTYTVDTPTGRMAPEHFKINLAYSNRFTVYSIDNKFNTGIIEISASEISEEVFFNESKVEKLYWQAYRMQSNGQFEEAISVLKKAFSLSSSTLMKSLILHEKGKSLFQLNQLDNALDSHFKAYDLFQETGNIKKTGQSLTEIAACYHQKHNLRMAEYYYYKSINQWEKTDISSEISTNYSNLSFLYTQNRNYYLQRINLLLAESAYKLDPYSFDRFSNIINLGNYYFINEEYEKSALTFENAIVLAIESGYKDTEPFFHCYANAARAWLYSGQTEKAVEILDFIQKSSAKHNFEKIIGSAKYTLGLIEIEKKNYDLAISLLNSSKKFISRDLLSLIDLTIGYAFFRKAQSTGNDNYFYDSKIIFQELQKETIEPWVKAQAIYWLSYLKLNHNLLDPDLLNRGVSIIETKRVQTFENQHKTSFFATQTHFYRLLLDIHADQALREGDSSSLGEAFLAAEKIRARTLLDIANQKPALPEGLPTMEEVQEYHRLVFEMEEHFFDNAALLELEKQLIPLAIKMDRLDPTTHKVEPDAIVTHTELQSAIGDPATLVLSYAFGLEKAYLLALDQKGLQLYELGEHASLQEDVGLINDYLQTHPQRRDPALEEGYQQVLARVSQRLLGSIPDLNHYQRLVMVPDSYLQRIPFAALPLPHQSSHSVSTLGSRFQLAMLPSASVWQALENRKRGQTPASKTIGILANPVFNGSDRRLSSVAEQDTRDFLPALPGTQREAEAIAAIAGKESFLVSGFSANRSMVVNNQLADYRYLHFATHGDINTQNPDLSSLVLSRFDSQGNAIPGSLTLGDISQLSLKADLVTLSACETASGKVVRGEGLISLARGFMAAGVPSVVGTLWKVPDDATAEFMTHFYLALLQENQPPAQALRHAQQTLQNSLQWKDPHFWSGFVLMGDWQ